MHFPPSWSWFVIFLFAFYNVLLNFLFILSPPTPQQYIHSTRTSISETVHLQCPCVAPVFWHDKTSHYSPPRQKPCEFTRWQSYNCIYHIRRVASLPMCFYVHFTLWCKTWNHFSALQAVFFFSFLGPTSVKVLKVFFLHMISSPFVPH